MKKYIEMEDYNRPYTCEKCGGKMLFKGVGEYQCESCREVAFDDYGKVRGYIEHHHGATVAEVSEETGVAKSRIRELLREERIEVAPTSTVFLKCEKCGTNILSGRYCTECVKKLTMEDMAEKARVAAKKKNVHGFGKAAPGESGAKRFHR